MPRVIIFSLLPLCLAAQAPPEPSPTFEVASIKPSAPDAQGSSLQLLRGGRVEARNIPLHMLIQVAYKVMGFQVTGGPSWIDTDLWSIVAKPEEGTPQPLFFTMMQSLLAERFGLALHRETREMPVYFLTAAKGGLKLAAIEGSCITPEPNMPPPPPGQKPPIFCGSVTKNGSDGMDAWKINIRTLASLIAGKLGRSVIDKTDFQGSFDVHLQFAPDQVADSGVFGGRLGGDAPPPPDSNAPSLFTALREQLGLKLESGKAPVEVIVIDHAEKPSEN